LALVTGGAFERSTYYRESLDAAGVGYTSDSSTRWDGAIVYRSLSSSSELRGSIGDDTEAILSEARWWILPVSMDELLDGSLPHGLLGRSRVALPIACGRDCKLLCLVGHAGNTCMASAWGTDEKARVGWYNRSVRPIRVTPDLCYDCHVLSTFFNGGN